MRDSRPHVNIKTFRRLPCLLNTFNMSSIRFIALLVAAASVAVLAHPAGLECGTDATSRLQAGQTIMKASVVDATDATVKVTVDGDKVTVTTPLAYYFAARAFGPGAELTLDGSDSFLLATANCTQQIYTNTTNPTAGSYTFSQKGATSIVVGYAIKPGVVSLVTTALEVQPL